MHSTSVQAGLVVDILGESGFVLDVVDDTSCVCRKLSFWAVLSMVPNDSIIEDAFRTSAGAGAAVGKT